MSVLTIPTEEVERYKVHGLARVDVSVAPNWRRDFGYFVSQIDAVALLSHPRPVHAWVKKISQPPQLRVCIATEKPNSPKCAIPLEPANELETLDVIVLQTPKSFGYDGPGDLVPSYTPYVFLTL